MESLAHLPAFRRWSLIWLSQGAPTIKRVKHSASAMGDYVGTAIIFGLAIFAYVGFA